MRRQKLLSEAFNDGFENFYLKKLFTTTFSNASAGGNKNNIVLNCYRSKLTQPGVRKDQFVHE